MFWGTILEPGKKYTSVVEDAFHLSMATLDLKSAKNDAITSVKLLLEGQNMILCHLAKPHTMQCNLDLFFPKGTGLSFSTDGEAVVHLTGYVITPDEDVFSDESEESESEKESIPNKNVKGASKVIANAKSQGDSKRTQKNITKKELVEKRKMESNQNVPKKKVKYTDLYGNSTDSSSEESSDTEAEFDNDESSKFDFSEDDTEDEDDSDLEEGESDEDDDDESQEEDFDTDSSSSDEVPSKFQTPKGNKNENQKSPIPDKKTPKTPTSNKKQDGKQNQEKQSLANGATPKSEKKDKKNKTPKSENKNKTNESSTGSPLPQKKQTLEGGVITEELRAGNGPIAKPGRMVTVYYVGRLKTNNRVFDQTNSGKGFSFRLGRNEVIKGWDVGLSGMKVGSKRRITCPASMAYGSKGSPPSIPPNSTLVFEVELKAVN